MNDCLKDYWKKCDAWKNSDQYKMLKLQQIPYDERKEMYKQRVIDVGTRVKYPDWDPSPESVNLGFTVEQVLSRNCIFIRSDKNEKGGCVGILVNAFMVDVVSEN